MNYEPKTRYKGFTLAEAMIATVVLGIAAAGVLLPFTSGATIRTDGMRRTLAAKLVSDLTEQIINTPFDQIVDTFNGYTEPQGQVKDATGAVFTDANYAKFSRNATCVYVYVPQESGTEDPIFIRITVEVLYRGKKMAIINRLISK